MNSKTLPKPAKAVNPANSAEADKTPTVVDVPHAPIERLSEACALPEHKGKPGRIVTDGIKAFKDYDYRTMAIAVVDGVLVKQEVSR